MDSEPAQVFVNLFLHYYDSRRMRQLTKSDTKTCLEIKIEHKALIFS